MQSVAYTPSCWADVRCAGTCFGVFPFSGKATSPVTWGQCLLSIIQSLERVEPYKWLYSYCVADVPSLHHRVTAMSSSGEESAGPSLGSPVGSRTSRDAHSQVRGGCSVSSLPQPGSLQEANHSPGHGSHGSAGVNKLSTSPHLPTSQGAAPWEVVLTALAELRDEVNKLKRDRLPPTPTPCRVNEGASTSQGMQHNGSPVHNFTGFPDPICEASVLTEQNFSDSVLMHNAKVFGPLDTVSEDIDQQVAEMVNFLFTNEMWDEDYKHICEDDITKGLKNCHALAPVVCNPEVLDALRSDAKKTDHRLQDVSKDILRAATIVTKFLLALDKVAQDSDLPEVAREVGVLNGALALLGNANYKNNLARQFAMKRKVNHKYAHLCSSKVPVTCFLFGDDVSQSAKQIEDSEKLTNKFIAKKLTSTWSFMGTRSRGYWGSSLHRSFSRYQPYGLLRHRAKGAQQHNTPRQDSISKNARSRAQHRQ
ncbi:uncharacterized protein LOC123500945 [Portunus trituberculatus]|uniref:uncharacterized protein LOC123500945 n=1 Tax=Portunus trituberculatus TaxID=210409 RepID=UPI001E1CD87C|nr:uncharacterized protein LOC123500945 [Portunus trituberculatus]